MRTGLALGAVNIPIRDVRFADEMHERLGLPVEMENDASCAAYAEFKLGAGRGDDDLLALDARHRRRRRRRLGRQALPRVHRARPHGDRRGRRAVPGRVLRPRARRGVLLRAPRPGRSRSACSGRTRPRTTSSSRSIRRSARSATTSVSRSGRSSTSSARRACHRRRLRDRRVRPPRSGCAARRAARGARAGRPVARDRAGRARRQRRA